MKMKPNARRIRSLREKNAWSQTQLAEIADVAERTIQRVEQGEPVGMETMKGLASAFSTSVEDLLDRPLPEPKVELLRRVTTGVNLFDVVAGSHAARYSHDELPHDAVEHVSCFMQDLQDYNDIWDDIGIGGQIQAKHEFTERIAELETFGLWVFVIRLPEKINKETTTWHVSNIAIMRSDNPKIVSLPEEGDVLPTIIVR